MILEGRVPKGMKLNSFNPDSDVANYPVIPENVIHGVAFIFDMNTVDSISEEQINAFKELQTIVAQKYIYRVVIGTKFELLGIQEDDHEQIYEYKPLQNKFTMLSDLTGMEKRSMFVVSNQWRGDQIEMIKCILALSALDNMIRNIDKFLKVTK
ncbi:interferon-induced protein 44-like [Mobula hypostoma]